MKKLLFFAFIALGGTVANAQPWMPAKTDRPIKYADALAMYRNSPYFIDEDEKGKGGKEENESKDHLFQRWNYYWMRHLDQDGYMVPPVVGLMEWQKYMAAEGRRSGARTTSIPSNWVFQGPDTSFHQYSGIGRINMVAFDPVDSNTVYVGSAAGSTWKTSDGGHSWTSLYNNLPTLGVADIKVNPQNRNTIYVATGDGDAGDAYSSGVIVSHDRGLTWSTTGVNWMPTAYMNAKSLLINPLDTTKMILATNSGIYKTRNAGATWATYGSGNYKQILYKPGDTSIVYASMYTDTGAQVMRSTDGGMSWTAVTHFNDAQRIALAVCPSAPNVVKALASTNSSGLKGVYSSSNSGLSFTELFTNDTSCHNEILGWDLGLPTSHCGGQGWYDLCIAVHPDDSNKVIVGGVNTYYSTDGGSGWEICNQWWGGVAGLETVHADKHCLAYSPLTKNVFETCDGGIYKNNGPITQPWIDLSNGIHITEFYRNAVDNNVSFVIGGAQDNGTKMVDGGASIDLTGGDGMQPLINYADPSNVWFCSYQNGAVDMTTDAGAHYHSITDTIHSGGGWVTPYFIHPTDPSTLYIGMRQVFKSANSGLSWSPISPVFDTDAYLDRIVMAPSNPNYIFATYFDYHTWTPQIRFTSDAGATWQSLTSPVNNYISSITVDPRNENRFWITISAYSVSKIFQCTINSGGIGIWLDKTGSLPNLPVLCMVIDTNTLTKYIGTDAAIYYRDTTMSSWALFNTNLPTVHVPDLHINYHTNELWAATFGRGMWKSIKADHTPIVGTANIENTPGSISVSPNPSHGNFTITAKGNLLAEKELNIQLITSDGKTVWQNTLPFDNFGKINVNASGLAPGFYICEVSSKNGLVRSKVVVY